MNKRKIISLNEKVISESREELAPLEKDGKYVFHGSPVLLDKLELRQPFTYCEETGKQEKHGEPSICATSFVDIAIFRAIVNKNNAPIKKYTSEFGNHENKKDKPGLYFKMTPETVKEIKNKVGYVYVFDRSFFKKFSNMEWRTNKEIVPLQSIQVSFDDLPEFDEVPYEF
ncbi:MAG: hypothetical protein WC797_00935 [Candidatus Paceibacterota bacterium]